MNVNRPLLFTCLMAVLIGAAGCGGTETDQASAPADDSLKGAAKGKGSCTPKAPGVIVDNTWTWGAPGSFGLKGQQLTYAIDVINYDAGCGSSSFVVTVSAPGGFSVSLPTTTINLRAGGSGYLWAYVTSPDAIPDGDYPLTVTVTRAGSADTAATTSFYKVYSSDTVAPTLYWPIPGNGSTITGRTYNLSVTSSDDRAVSKIELYLDGAQTSTTACDDVAYSCQLSYAWTTIPGSHTATFKSYDWLGNVSVLTSSFTVN
jgi:hypothetical protein